MIDRHKKLTEQVQRVGNAFETLKKGPVFIYRGVDLYASEIHMMKTVASNPDENASGIAALLGVTKGAVSQTLSKLEAKGVFRKTHDSSYKNELRIELTAFGGKALKAFFETFDRQWAEFNQYVDSLSPDQRRLVSGFLDRLEAFLRSID